MKHPKPKRHRMSEKMPIYLNKNCVAIIKLYKRNDDWTEIMLNEFSLEDKHELLKESAKEFIRQLEDEWCFYFVEHLIKELKKCLPNNRS